MKSIYSVAVIALISTSSAVTLVQNQNMHVHQKHACDFVDDAGEEISTSLMPEYVQIRDDEPAAEAAPASLAQKGEDDVASTREKFQQMQAQMDAAVAQAD
jgi:hypothetical protein|tara:strand:+ start:93 stop:395 length:303 start_codon:yes stop_codon:yes gene_type:complete